LGGKRKRGLRKGGNPGLGVMLGETGGKRKNGDGRVGEKQKRHGRGGDAEMGCGGEHETPVMKLNLKKAPKRRGKKKPSRKDERRTPGGGGPHIRWAV